MLCFKHCVTVIRRFITLFCGHVCGKADYAVKPYVCTFYAFYRKKICPLCIFFSGGNGFSLSTGERAQTLPNGFQRGVSTEVREKQIEFFRMLVFR